MTVASAAAGLFLATVLQVTRSHWRSSLSQIISTKRKFLESRNSSDFCKQQQPPIQIMGFDYFRDSNL